MKKQFLIGLTCILALAVFISCDSSSDSPATLSALTVEDVDAWVKEQGYTPSGTKLVFEDGKTDSGTIDIDRVVMTRIKGSFSDNDLGFAFDFDNRTGTSDLFDTTHAVLYLDTDQNAATGMGIAGIGADVRLTQTVDTDNVHLRASYDDASGTWVKDYTSGYFSSKEMVNNHGKIMVGIYGTSDLLSGSAANAVMAVETRTDDNTLVQRLDATTMFEVTAIN